MEKFPTIRIIAPNSSPTANTNPVSTEPEIEDLCQDSEIQEIISSVGLDQQYLDLKELPHNPGDQSCTHCILLKKLSSLKLEILKMREEAKESEIVIKLKQAQNKKIRTIIEKFEESIPVTSGFLDLQKTSKKCNCNKSCIII